MIRKEELLKRIVRLMPDGVFAIDREGKIIIWNKTLEEMTGIKEQEIIEKTNFEHAIPFYGFRRPMPVDYILHHEMQCTEPLNKKNDSIEIEAFFQNLYDGRGGWVRLTAIPLLNESCDLIGAVQIVRDITARKMAESNLKKFKNIVEHAPVAVILTKFSGEIVYCNQTFLKYTELKAIENINIYEIFPEISLYEIHNGHLKEMKYNNKVFRLRGIRIEDEELDVYAIFITDITELRKYEEQVIISHKMESIRRLASTYTHDLKNILNGIKGFAQLALQRENFEQAKSDIEKLLNTLSSATENIRKILNFGKDTVRNPELIDLRDAVMGSIPLIKATLRKNINLITEFAENPLIVFADKTDIEKIVLNLILNSQDAMPNGGELRIEVKGKSLPEKFVAIQKQENSENYAYLSISDTGTGMDEKTKAMIFEPFFTTKGEKGSGLGLPTVYYIVQLLKGYIFVDSEVGKGTRFEIYIPLKI